MRGNNLCTIIVCTAGLLSTPMFAGIGKNQAATGQEAWDFCKLGAPKMALFNRILELSGEGKQRYLIINNTPRIAEYLKKYTEGTEWIGEPRRQFIVVRLENCKPLMTTASLIELSISTTFDQVKFVDRTGAPELVFEMVKLRTKASKNRVLSINTERLTSTLSKVMVLDVSPNMQVINVTDEAIPKIGAHKFMSGKMRPELADKLPKLNFPKDQLFIIDVLNQPIRLRVRLDDYQLLTGFSTNMSYDDVQRSLKTLTILWNEEKEVFLLSE